MIKMPQGSINIVVHGIAGFRIVERVATEPYLKARFEVLKVPTKMTKQLQALMVNVRQTANRVIALSPNVPEEASVLLENIENPSALADFLAANLSDGSHREAGAARGARSRQAARRGSPRPGQPARGAGTEQQDPGPGQGVHRQDASASTSSRSSSRPSRRSSASRTTSGPRRSRSCAQKIAKANMPEAGEEEAPARTGPPRARSRRPRPSTASSARTWTGCCELPWSVQHRGQARHPTGREDPQPRPLRPREGQEAHPGIPRRAQAQSQAARPDPVLRRPAGRRQDLAGQVHRPRDGPQVHPHARWAASATRPTSAAIGAPTSAPCPAGSSRKSARPQPQPRLHARRAGQDRRGFPRRPGQRPAGGARPGAEQHVHRPLPRRAVRPVARACSSPRPTTSTRSRRRCATAWRSSSCPATPPQEKLEHRQTIPGAAAAEGERPQEARRSTIKDEAIAAIIDSYTREAGVRNLERQIASVCRAVATEIASGQEETDDR